LRYVSGLFVEPLLRAMMDIRTRPISEFLARARNLANDKARELGWGWVL
jgi:hypothetical protein